MRKHYKIHIDGAYKIIYVNSIELKHLIRTHVVRGIKRIYA